MKINKNNLSLGRVALGAIFLFNPTINIVDPLPDFIGYLFIISGIAALAYLNDECMVAKKSLLYLTGISVAKLLCCFLLPFVMDDTFGVLFSFSFAVAEGVFFISAFYHLFEGITSLGMRYGNDNVFYVPHTKSKARKIERLKAELVEGRGNKDWLLKKIKKLEKRKSVSKLRNFTVTAFIVRALGSVIPTLPALSMADITEFYADSINWRNYVAPLYILVWIVGFSVCIPWLRSLRRYIKGLLGERELCSYIYGRYEREVLSDPRLLMADRMKAVLLLCLTAVALTFCMPVDGVNIFPNFISATLIIAAFLMMIPNGRVLCIAGSISAFVWGAFSLIGTYLQAEYARDYVRSTNDDIYKAVTFGTVRAVKMFGKMQTFAWIEGALFVITFAILAKAVIRCLDSSIEMIPKRADGKDESPKRLKKCLVPVWILGALTALANCALLTAMKYFTEAWIIYSGIVVVFFVFSLRAYYHLDDTVYERLRRKF